MSQEAGIQSGARKSEDPVEQVRVLQEYIDDSKENIVATVIPEIKRISKEKHDVERKLAEIEESEKGLGDLPARDRTNGEANRKAAEFSRQRESLMARHKQIIKDLQEWHRVEKNAKNDQAAWKEEIRELTSRLDQPGAPGPVGPEPTLFDGLLTMLGSKIQDKLGDQEGTSLNSISNAMFHTPIAKLEATQLTSTEAGRGADRLEQRIRRETQPPTRRVTDDDGSEPAEGEVNLLPQTDLQIRASKLASRLTKGAQAGKLFQSDNVALALADSISALGARFEFIRVLPGGQELLNQGKELSSIADRLMTALTQNFGMLANSIMAAENDKQLDEYSKQVNDIDKYFAAYDGIIGSVLEALRLLIVQEAWNAAIQKPSGTTAKLASAAAVALSGILGAVRAAAPPGLGIGALASTGQAIISDIDSRMQRLLRNLEIMERIGTDPLFPLGELNKNMHLVAARVRDKQKQNVKKAFNILAIPAAEGVPGWALLRIGIEGVIDSYYSARVDKLEKKLAEEAGHKVDKVDEIKDAIVEFGKEDATEHLVVACKKTIADKAGEIASELMEGAKEGKGRETLVEVARAVNAEFFLEAAKEAATEFGEALLVQLVVRVGQAIMAECEISTAQAVSGDDFTSMLDLTDGYQIAMAQAATGTAGPYPNV